MNYREQIMATFIKAYVDVLISRFGEDEGLEIAQLAESQFHREMKKLRAERKAGQ